MYDKNPQYEMLTDALVFMISAPKMKLDVTLVQLSLDDAEA